jgi:hypothetical protein
VDHLPLVLEVANVQDEKADIEYPQKEMYNICAKAGES